MGGSSTFSSKGGSQTDEYDEALANLTAHKEDYGTGCCTKILIKNETGDKIIANKDSYSAESGRWDTNPPESIMKDCYGTCLHCHRDGSACGSIG